MNTKLTSSAAIRIGDKVTIRPRGRKGTYVAEFSHRGQHCRRTLKTANASVARQRAIQLEADLARGEYATQPNQVAIASAVKEYLESKTGEGRKPATISKYTQWLESFEQYARAHHAVFLQHVTGVLFEQYRAARSESQSPKSMYTGLVIVKQFLKWASGAGREYLTKNPIQSYRISKPHVDRQYAPTTDEVAAILDKATGYRKVALGVAAFAGLRAQEMQMLRLRGVDLKGGWIRVEHQESWTPKTGRGRKIPIHPNLIVLLNSMPAGDRPYFFVSPPSLTYPDGNRPMNVKGLNEYLQELAKELGFAVGRAARGITLHGLRHYFETECVNSRVPQMVVDAWMGHSGGGHMSSIYYGHTDQKHREFMAGVEFPRIQAGRNEEAS